MNNINTKTVENFDLKRYLGEWHQIATIPSWFQANLVDVKAKYTKISNSEIQVENSGIGKLFRLPIRIKGTARVPDSIYPAALKVKFLFQESDYFVLELDTNYQWALVGGSNRNNLWILSRDTSIPMKLYNEIKNKARLRGYNTDKLRIT